MIATNHSHLLWFSIELSVPCSIAILCSLSPSGDPSTTFLHIHYIHPSHSSSSQLTSNTAKYNKWRRLNMSFRRDWSEQWDFLDQIGHPKKKKNVWKDKMVLKDRIGQQKNYKTRLLKQMIVQQKRIVWKTRFFKKKVIDWDWSKGEAFLFCKEKKNWVKGW